jgi:integrase
MSQREEESPSFHQPAEESPSFHQPAEKSPTFHEFASQWFDAHRHEILPASAADYKGTLTGHLLPFFGEHHLSQITTSEIDRYKSAKVRARELGTHERPLANSSINETLNLLAQVLEVAVEYGHIQVNPARGRRRRLKAPPPKRTWLEPEQIKPLLDATVHRFRGGKIQPDPRTRVLFATAICTGLRVGELLALRWGEIDLAQGRLTVVHSKTDAGTGRQIDLWPEIRETLIAYRAETRHPLADDHVFATRTGKADLRSNISRRLKRAVVRTNKVLVEDEQIPSIALDLTPHSLRRTFATLLYLRGESPAYVMNQMGHADPQLALRIYTKVRGRQRGLGPGVHLLGVLDGPKWTHPIVSPTTAT